MSTVTALVVVIPLFAPRVAVHVVAVGLPASGMSGGHEADAADPFGGFPEVEVEDESSNAVLAGVILTEGISDDDDQRNSRSHLVSTRV